MHIADGSITYPTHLRLHVGRGEIDRRESHELEIFDIAAHAQHPRGHLSESFVQHEIWVKRINWLGISRVHISRTHTSLEMDVPSHLLNARKRENDA